MSVVDSVISSDIVGITYTDEGSIENYEGLSSIELNNLRALYNFVPRKFGNASDQKKIIEAYLANRGYEYIYALKSMNTDKMCDYFMIIIEDHRDHARGLLEYMGIVCSSTNILLEEVCKNPFRFSGSEENEYLNTRLNRYIGSNIKPLLIPDIAHKDIDAKDIVDSIMREQLQLIRESVGQAKKGCLCCDNCSPYCVLEKRLPGTGINRII